MILLQKEYKVNSSFMRVGILSVFPDMLLMALSLSPYGKRQQISYYAARYL